MNATNHYAPLILAAAYREGLPQHERIHIHRVLAALVDQARHTPLDAIAIMTWGELCGMILVAVAISNTDPRNWNARARSRGFPIGAGMFPVPCFAAAEALEDDTLAELAERLVVSDVISECSHVKEPGRTLAVFFAELRGIVAN